MKLRLVATILATTALAVGCSSGGGEGGPGTRLAVEGQAQVSRAGGPFEAVNGSDTVHAGDRVRLDSGVARLTVGRQGEMELRPGAEVQLRLPGNGSDLVPALTAGKALVAAETGTARVTAADADVSLAGSAARLAVDRGAVIAVYTGSAAVSGGGRSVNVPALRQLTVSPTGEIGERPTPVRYEENDAWDKRFLGDAMDLGSQLVARSQGFTAQLAPGEGHTPGFYRTILPALEGEPSFDVAALGATRPPGESLVALAITVESTRGTFGERLASVLAFRDEGAEWGLVALDQGVTRATLVSRVDEAISKGPAIAAEKPAPQAPAPRSSTRGSTSRSSPSSSGPASTISAGSPTTTPPASTSPPPGGGPVQTGVPLVDNTVNSLVDLVSGVLGGLGGQSSTATP